MTDCVIRKGLLLMQQETFELPTHIMTIIERLASIGRNLVPLGNIANDTLSMDEPVTRCEDAKSVTEVLSHVQTDREDIHCER